MRGWIRLIYITVFSSLLVSVVFAGEYLMPPNGDDLVGQNYIITVHKGDSLTRIRKRHGVSYEELLDANPNVNFYRLKVGQKIFISKQFILPPFRRGIVINVPELRLYYFTPDGHYVYTFPIGLGRQNWRTPLFEAKVIRKDDDPAWYVPESIRDYVFNKTGEWLPDVILPGPKNPLGKYALYLSKPGYMIHGTNIPSSVGTFISSGCMRLLREPIETLYHEVPIGTSVRVIHHPVKAGWRGRRLYLESHEPIDSYTYKTISPLNELDAETAIYHAVRLRPSKINWNLAYKNIREHLGIPEQIGYRADLRR